MKPVLTLQLYRENRHVEPSCARDVGEIVGAATLALLIYIVVLLVMA